jgi:hypothetical protein
MCHLSLWIGDKVFHFQTNADKQHKPYHWKTDEPTGFWFSCTLRHRAAPGRWFAAGLESLPGFDSPAANHLPGARLYRSGARNATSAVMKT